MNLSKKHIIKLKMPNLFSNLVETVVIKILAGVTKNEFNL